MDIQENIPLAPFTTFRLGGPGRFVLRAGTTSELKEAITFAAVKKLPVLLLGGGSNMLISDEGFAGVVIKIELSGVVREGDTYVAAAGESWDALVARTVADGMWGLENLSGIPGSVGGAVVQNIGAYGAALSQTLAWVEALEVRTGSVVRLANNECAFGYRDSVFKHEGAYVVLRAAFNLSSEPNPNLEYRDPNKVYKDIARVLVATPNPTVADLRQAVLSIRADKFPDLSQEGSAGSFFLNPIVSAATAQALKERYPEMPLFTMPETSDIKVPLGWLLDRVLALKGRAVGGARLFEKQALVIAATRDATSRDVRALANAVIKEVKEKIGIEIEAEVRLV